MLIFVALVNSEEDRNKLEQIYIKYKNLMYYIANDILKNTHEAEDVVQISIIKIANYIEKIDEINSNKTKHLIVTIVKSTSIDIYRRKKDKHFIDIDEVGCKIQSEEVTERYTSISIEREPEDTNKNSTLGKSYFYPGDIPAGYKESDAQSYGPLRLIYFDNEKGDRIEFLQTESDSDFQVDTEDAITVDIRINGYKGILVSKEDFKTLLWFTDNNNFYIMGKLDQEEIVSMAESLEYVK